MTEKFIINQNGEIEDTIAHITFDSFMELVIILNGQSRQLNGLWEENEQLKIQLQNTSAQRDEFHSGARENANRVGKLKKENEQLKQELFEIKKDYLIETYSDNPARRDEKIHGLKEEFKERFGDFE